MIVTYHTSISLWESDRYLLSDCLTDPWHDTSSKIVWPTPSILCVLCIGALERLPRKAAEVLVGAEVCARRNKHRNVLLQIVLSKLDKAPVVCLGASSACYCLLPRR